MGRPKTRHYFDLHTYMQDHELESSRQVAEHFDIGQTTAMRWLKNEHLWVVTVWDGTSYVWVEVYTERTLKEREEP